MKFGKKLKKTDNKKTKDNKKESAKTTQANWYVDRYQSVVLQRNFLFLFSIFALIIIAVAIVTVQNLSSQNRIEPFIIEIEDETGLANVTRPFAVRQYTHNEQLQRYFLTDFIKKFNGYEKRTLKDDRRTVLSYAANSWITGMYNKKMSKSGYGKLESFYRVDIEVASIFIKHYNGNQYIADVIYRTKPVTLASNRRVPVAAPSAKEMQARIVFTFADLKLTQSQRADNPMGFQVINYEEGEFNAKAVNE